ncbi:hypothetical protein BDV97DRAFT_228637 [Delphinella strobiligena]|nr:hypothetical protein BDV97DRAFT_228637 [Delphinella strobiligena]
MYCLKFFAIGALGLVHMVAAQSAVLYFTSVINEASVGLPVAITYNAPNNDPATIVLRQGDSANLATISTLTTSATNGTYTWIPSPSLPPAKDYALQILQDSEINYSAAFTLQASNSTLANTTTTALTTLPCTVSGNANATVYPYGSGLVTATGNPGGPIVNATFVSPTLTANTAGPGTVTSSTAAITSGSGNSSSGVSAAAAATGAAGALRGIVLGAVGVGFALL